MSSTNGQRRWRSEPGWRNWLWLWLLNTVVLWAGFFSGFTHPQTFAHALSPALGKLQELAGSVQDDPAVWHTAGLIFVNNALVATLMMLSGTLAGVIPVLILWFNGVVIGYVAAAGAAHLALPAWRIVVFGLLPHGVFELWALLWSSAWGLYLGWVSVSRVSWGVLRSLGRSPLRTPPLQWRRELRRAVYRLPGQYALLLLAAYIEAGLTPHVMQWALHVP
ncbi:MAG: stage II sporulation protein M [Alicyclobacillus sp.]|nr:stage II sporulation protein M [Alicyclobacillus sp.]